MNAAAIEAAVRATPGVVALFATAPGAPLVEATDAAVSVSIGVAATAQAPATAAAVAAAIRLLAPRAEVSVRVSRVA